MKAVEIRELATDVLEAKVSEMKEELFKLKFQLSLGQFSNTAKIREVRRDIARIKTIIKERELAN
jgi:large subunit ribosomal protein L29